MIKLFFNITEDWPEIPKAIKEVQTLLKDFNVQITSKKINLDVTIAGLYETKKSLSGFSLQESKVFSNKVIKALGLVNGAYDYFGIIVDKSKALEDEAIHGQFDKGQKTIQIFTFQGESKEYGLDSRTYGIAHELLHMISFHYGLTDTLHDWISKNTSLDGYIEKLKSEMEPKKKYKYFTEKEVAGLKPELVEMLDKAREIASVPLKITSGVRSIEKNEDIGGVKDSEHLTGEGVDLSCTISQNRFKIVKALLEVGFNRIGIYERHIHAGISKNHPQNVMWYK